MGVESNINPSPTENHSSKPNRRLRLPTPIARTLTKAALYGTLLPNLIAPLKGLTPNINTQNFFSGNTTSLSLQDAESLGIIDSKSALASNPEFIKELNDTITITAPDTHIEVDNNQVFLVQNGQKVGLIEEHKFSHPDEQSAVLDIFQVHTDQNGDVTITGAAAMVHVTEDDFPVALAAQNFDLQNVGGISVRDITISTNFDWNQPFTTNGQEHVLRINDTNAYQDFLGKIKYDNTSQKLQSVLVGYDNNVNEVIFACNDGTAIDFNKPVTIYTNDKTSYITVISGAEAQKLLSGKNVIIGAIVVNKDSNTFDSLAVIQEGRNSNVGYILDGKPQHFGIIDPNVLNALKLPYPVSTIKLDLNNAYIKDGKRIIPIADSPYFIAVPQEYKVIWTDTGDLILIATNGAQNIFFNMTLDNKQLDLEYSNPDTDLGIDFLPLGSTGTGGIIIKSDTLPNTFFIRDLARPSRVTPSGTTNSQSENLPIIIGGLGLGGLGLEEVIRRYVHRRSRKSILRKHG